jgi:hypothetical protein
MSTLRLSSHIVMPLKPEELFCLRGYAKTLTPLLGVTYQGDIATGYSRWFLSVAMAEAREAAGELAGKARACLYSAEASTDTGLRHPSHVLLSLSRRMEAEYVGYRASQVFGSVEKGGTWLHNERLHAFDGKKAITLIMEDGNARDVLRYLDSLMAGAAG